MSEKSAQPMQPRNNAEFALQLTMPAGMHNTLRGLENIIMVLVGWMSITLRTFTRREFGEEALNVGHILTGLLTIQFFLMLANFQTAMSFIPYIQPLAEARVINRTLVTCYIVVSIIHVLRIVWRNNQGIPWHSHNFGISWLEGLLALPPVTLWGFRLQMTDGLLYRLLEPALCYAVIWLCLPDSFTRSYLLWAAIALMIQNNLVFNKRRQTHLAAINAEIESSVMKQLHDETFGTSNPAITQTMGHPVMPIPPMMETLGIQPGDIEATVAETMGASAATATRTT